MLPQRIAINVLIHINHLAQCLGYKKCSTSDCEGDDDDSDDDNDGDKDDNNLNDSGNYEKGRSRNLPESNL